MKFLIVSYRNINSNGSTITKEKVIEANSVRGAKMQASMLFPTAGRWNECHEFNENNELVKNGQHCKGTAKMIGHDRLYVVPFDE